jgi:hypothetical protein
MGCQIQTGTISTGLATTDDFLDQAHGGDSRPSWDLGKLAVALEKEAAVTLLGNSNRA